MNEEEYQFSDNVTILEKGDVTYYIIGTAHISQKSVEEVKEVIDAVQPDTVCVELCKTRYQSITDENVWKKLDIFEVIKQGKTLYLLAHLALSSFQKKMGEKLGVKPGAELMAAVEKAKENNAELVLADRDVQITLKRTWGNLSFFNKVSVMVGLMGGMFTKEEITAEELEKIKEKDQLSEMMDTFAKEFPRIKEPLIDERDKFLISSIREASGKKIVAVVGAGHVRGMVEQFEKEIDREKLNELPPKKKFVGLLKWIIPALVLLAFYFGFQAKSEQTFYHMLQAWIIPNSIMCALMTIIAGGRFLSVVTAFIASPITSLNPTIGAGLVVGFVEAWQRKPTVEDCEQIKEITGIKDLYKNAFTRVLLVAFLANFGSALGAWIGISWIVTILG